MPDPSQIAGPDARALSRLLVDLQNRVDRLERGSRTPQLGQSSIHDGALQIWDSEGNERVRVGRQPDGKFGWGAANGDAPPRPDTPELVPTLAGFNVKWNGQFAGIAPSDFTYTVVYASPAGAMFALDDSLIAGRLLGAGVIPVTAIGGEPIDPEQDFWVRLVSYNASHVPSEASFTAGPVRADLLSSEGMEDDSVTEDKIAIAAVVARHIRAGEITADKLEAILVLASQIIAGDPAGWHLMLGDPNTPILYWDGTTTGFAVARDAITGAANVYVQGRMEFGSASQIEQDYVDIADQPAAGFQTPILRQERTSIYSAPTTTPTPPPPWVSATNRGSLLLCLILAEGSGSVPTLTVPLSFVQAATTTIGTTRLSLYYVPNAALSHSDEPMSASVASSWSVGLFEYAGIATTTPLDVYTSLTGTSTVPGTGTTGTSTQANELQIAAFGTPDAALPGDSRIRTPNNGFAAISQGGGYFGQGTMAAAKIVSSTGTTYCEATLPTSGQWLGIIATFRSAAAAGQPPQPSAGTYRLFSRSRAGYAVPHVIDNTGGIYPMGRVPYARARLNVDVPLAAVTDVWAQGNWVITEDPYSMVALSTGAGVYSSITAPIAGQYLVTYRTIYNADVDAIVNATCFVSRNVRDGGNRVASDSRRFMRYGGGDLTPVQAIRVAPLAAGDVLYWGNWSQIATTIKANAAGFGAPTEIAVHYLGPT